jgi:hypothetical protein
VAAVVQPMSTQLMKADLPQQWANTINGHLKTSVESIFAMGRDLIAAKKQVGHGPWLTMFLGRPDSVAKPIRFHESTAQRIMAVARHRELSNTAHVQVLPPSWGTLYELTKVPELALRKALTNGTIRPEMERREVLALRGSNPKRRRPSRPPNDPREVLDRVPLTEDDLVAAIYDKGCQLCQALGPDDVQAFVARVRAAMTAIEEKYLSGRDDNDPR